MLLVVLDTGVVVMVVVLEIGVVVIVVVLDTGVVVMVVVLVLCTGGRVTVGEVPVV